MGLGRGNIGLVACGLALLAFLAGPTAANAAAKWSLRQLPAKTSEPGAREQPTLDAVSCVGESLCVAVGAFDTIATSRAPTGAADAWHAVYPLFPEPRQSCLEAGESAEFCIQPRGSIDSISCPTEGLCVAVGYEGSVWVSTDPAAEAWTVGDTGHGSPHLTAVSCPSTSLCVAVSGGTGPLPGRIYTTTDPTSGVWQETRLANPPDLRAVSCAGPAACVAVAKAGRIFTTIDPTGGTSAWGEVGSPTARDLEGIACLATLCVAGDGGGNVLTSTEPTGGVPFAATNAGGSVQITGVSCPITTSCVAVDNNADVLTSTDPTGGPTAWAFENLVPFEAEPPDHGQFVKNALWGAACGTPSFCVLVGAAARIFTSTEPFAAPSPSPAAGDGPGRAKKRLRPRTHLVFAEHFWKFAIARGRHAKARFRFYSRDGARGFQCRRDRARWRPCHSPLRYWVAPGHHILRVRAIGRTGLRGPVADLPFQVAREHPRH